MTARGNEREPLAHGQGIPPAQGEGGKVVTDVRQVTTTETLIHQETVGSAAGAEPAVLFTAPQIETGVSKNARKPRARLLDPITGKPFLTTKDEREARKLIKQEVKAKEEAERQRTKARNAARRLKKEAEKTAEKPKKQSKKTPVEAQAIWKELTHEERFNKRLRIERLKLLFVLSQITKQKIIDENGRSKVKEVKKMKEQVIVFIKDKRTKIAGALLAGALIGIAGFAIGERIEDRNENHQVSPIATATPKPSEAAGTPTPEAIATATATEVPQTTEIVGIWPKTAAEAAAEFGTDPYSLDQSHWGKTEEGEGWWMTQDSKENHRINLGQFVAEGWLTNEDGSAQAVVAKGGSRDFRGFTVWDTADEQSAQSLWNQMKTQPWANSSKNAPKALGFVPVIQ